MMPWVDFLARRLWWGCLWLMRRPRVKHLRLHFVDYLPERRRQGAWNSFVKQEKWARRYGLTVMRWTVTVFSLIILFQLIGAGVYELQMRGQLALPE